MTSQRKLKYSVSDASRRMYKIETNGIYRKLENPWPTDSQLRQQRFEERQRPLSQILASSSFRETFDRKAFTRGQSLSNLKKSRQRNSLNLPNSFSLDLEYDVNANAKIDGELASTGGLSASTPRLRNSAFDFVPDQDIITLSDVARSEIGSTSGTGKQSVSATLKSRKSSSSSSSSSSTSSSSSSTSKANSVKSQSTFKGNADSDQRQSNVRETSPKSEEDKLNRSQLLEKRRSFKEVFPINVNEEFLNKNKVESADRRASFSNLSSPEINANRIFDSDVNIRTKTKNAPLNKSSREKSSSSDSDNSDELDFPKRTTEVFDSNEVFQPSHKFEFSGKIERPKSSSSSESEFSEKGRVHHIFDSSVLHNTTTAQLHYKHEPIELKTASLPREPEFPSEILKHSSEYSEKGGFNHSFDSSVLHNAPKAQLHYKHEPVELKSSSLSTKPEFSSSSPGHSSDSDTSQDTGPDSDRDAGKSVVLDRTVSVESVPPPLPLSSPPELSSSDDSRDSSIKDDEDRDSLIELLVNSSKNPIFDGNASFEIPTGSSPFDDLVLNSPKHKDFDLHDTSENQLDSFDLGDPGAILPEFKEVDITGTDGISLSSGELGDLIVKPPETEIFEADVAGELNTEACADIEVKQPKFDACDVDLTQDISIGGDIDVNWPESEYLDGNNAAEISNNIDNVDLRLSKPKLISDRFGAIDGDSGEDITVNVPCSIPQGVNEFEGINVTSPKIEDLPVQMASWNSPSIDDKHGKLGDLAGTTITYYGPIYASNNTLILPHRSEEPCRAPEKKKGIDLETSYL